MNDDSVLTFLWLRDGLLWCHPDECRCQCDYPRRERWSTLLNWTWKFSLLVIIMKQGSRLCLFGCWFREGVDGKQIVRNVVSPAVSLISVEYPASIVIVHEVDSQNPFKRESKV